MMRRRNLVSSWPLVVAVLIFAAVVVVVNPLRETALMDDWSYAHSVQRLLSDGRLELTQWSAATPLFLFGWGALFGKVFGFSYGALRVSTLVLTAIGGTALYALAREQGLDRRIAPVVVILYLSSPLVLRFAFTFMTDMPFVSLVLVSLAATTRSLRTGGRTMLALGSLAAAAAILTRQFGIALPVGFVVVALLHRADRRVMRMLLVASVAPAIATIGQYYFGIAHPTWTQAYTERLQGGFFHDPLALTLGSVGRLGIIAAYLGAFCLPLSLAVLPGIIRSPRGVGRLVVAAALVAAGVAIYSAFGASILMPFIGLRMGQVALWPGWLRVAYSLLAVAGGAGLLVTWSRRYRGANRQAGPGGHLLDAVALASLAPILLFLQFNDEYLIVLVPLALIVLAREGRVLLERRTGLVVLAGLVLMLPSALTTRAILSSNEAAWTLGQRAVASGTDPTRVAVSWPWYSAYNFDRFMAEVRPDSSLTSNDYHGWINRNYVEHATLVISETAPAANDPDWSVADSISWQDFDLSSRRLYLWQRKRPDAPIPCCAFLALNPPDWD